MARQIGKFVWYTLTTPDTTRAQGFYREVVGWDSASMDMGGSPYQLLARGEQTQAGVVTPQVAGTPPNWQGHMSVEDVDATVAAAIEHGGAVIVAAYDIPNIGRNAVIADPQGAIFSVFTAADAGGEEEAASGMAWMELWSKDAEAVIPFYEAVFGFEVATMDMPSGPYHILRHSGQQRAGLKTSPAAEVPAMWLPYIQVDDVDAAFSTATASGGKIKQAPVDVPGVGRFGTIADVAGAVVGLLAAPQS